MDFISIFLSAGYILEVIIALLTQRKLTQNYSINVITKIPFNQINNYSFYIWVGPLDVGNTST